MYELSISLLLNIALALILLLLIVRKFSPSALFFTLLYIAVLFTCSALNFHFEFFEQKFAAEFAYDIFVGEESLRNNSGFLLQYILNYPAFLVTDAWWAAISTNIVITGCTFWYVFTKNRKLAFILLAPAIINFSMFSLRDPIISTLFFILTLLGNETYRLKAIANNLKYFSVAALFSIIRPENIIIAIIARMYLYVKSVRDIRIYILIVPVAIVGSLLAISYVPSFLGFESNVSILELPSAIQSFYESRAVRWGYEGDDSSNILGGSLVYYPIYIRYPIQIITFFVLPLPFEITKLSLLLAFIDSIFFIYTYSKFHKHGSYSSKVMFWIYVLSIAFFSNNYGNVFRLRLPAYFIMVAGMLRR